MSDRVQEETLQNLRFTYQCAQLKTFRVERGPEVDNAAGIAWQPPPPDHKSPTLISSHARSTWLQRLQYRHEKRLWLPSVLGGRPIHNFPMEPNLKRPSRAFMVRTHRDFG